METHTEERGGNGISKIDKQAARSIRSAIFRTCVSKLCLVQRLVRVYDWTLALLQMKILVSLEKCKQGRERPNNTAGRHARAYTRMQISYTNPLCGTRDDTSDVAMSRTRADSNFGNSRRGKYVTRYTIPTAHRHREYLHLLCRFSAP